MSLTLERTTTYPADPIASSKVPQPKQNGISTTDANGLSRLHLTVDSFYKIVDSGALSEPNSWELLQGEIVNRENMNPPHAFVADELAGQLREKSGGRFLVREEKPIRLTDDSEPTPDITVVRGKRNDYATRHPLPEDIQLVIEVADTTEQKDTGIKARLYALAGISEYWVILINKRQVNVYRHPTQEGYPQPEELTAEDTISLLSFPDMTIPIADMLPPLQEETNASTIDAT